MSLKFGQIPLIIELAALELLSFLSLQNLYGFLVCFFFLYMCIVYFNKISDCCVNIVTLALPSKMGQIVQLFSFSFSVLLFEYLSRLVEKPTMWFLNRSDTNRPVQAQERARGLKFWI